MINSSHTPLIVVLYWLEYLDITNIFYVGFKSKYLVPVTQTVAQLGSTGFLSCDVLSSGSKDDIELILWFKDNATKPMYRYPARRNLVQSTRWKHVNV